MTTYVNMHGSNRLTLREATALWEAIDRGVLEMEDAADDECPSVSRGKLNSAIRAKQKIERAIRIAEEKNRAQAE